MRISRVIAYVPRPQFMPLHETQKRFSVMLAHRRSGKTVAGIARGFQKLFSCQLPSPRVGLVFPFLKQAKTSAWHYAKQMSIGIPERVPHESELKITFGDREIRLYGADNPTSIRGGYFDHALCDEWAFADPTVYPTIIRPMLSDRNGSIDFSSTPNGKNHFYDLYREAGLNDKYFQLTLKADTSGLLSPEELADIRADPLISENVYNQEYLCSFEAATEGAFYSREMSDAEAQGRIKPMAIDPSLPVVTAWDFGNSDDTVIWFIQWTPDGLRFIDFYKNNRETIAHYAAVVNGKGYRYAAHYAPHDLAQNHFGMLETREKQFRDHGIVMVKLPRISSELEGINALRSILPICSFDRDRCAYGIESLKSYRAEFDYTLMKHRDNPLRDWSKHACDAAAQAALAYRSIFRRSQPEKTEDRSKIIIRPPTFDDFAATDRRKRLKV